MRVEPDGRVTVTFPPEYVWMGRKPKLPKRYWTKDMHEQEKLRKAEARAESRVVKRRGQ